AKDLQIDRSGGLVSQRAFDAGIEIRRPQADALVEPPANGEEQPVERDMVLDARMADGPEQNRIVPGELVEIVPGGHAAVFEVKVGSPGVWNPLEPDARAGGGRIDRADRFTRHFGANAVPFNHGD